MCPRAALQLVPGDFIEIHAENDPQGNERVHVVQIVDIFTNDEVGADRVGCVYEGGQTAHVTCAMLHTA